MSNLCVWVCDGDKSGDVELWLFQVSAEGCGKRASRYVLSLGPVVGVILGRIRSAVGSIASRLAMGWDETGPVLVNLVCQGLIWRRVGRLCAVVLSGYGGWARGMRLGLCLVSVQLSGQVLIGIAGRKGRL